MSLVSSYLLNYPGPYELTGCVNVCYVWLFQAAEIGATLFLSPFPCTLSA